MNNNAIILPDPDRLRQIPPHFSWVDHRLLREGHLIKLSSTRAAALYLVLVTVGDARGISYYSDKKLLTFLPETTAEEFVQSRRELIQNGLIAYRRPYYQVLSLDPDQIKTAQLRHRNESTTRDRSQQAIPMKDALKHLRRTLDEKD